ncbi:MAG: DUF917 domain-containing protein [Acidobacteriota bacterium]|nr:DUF917 domain-containing protein [Acidobacteriota bacterium]
MRIGHSDIDDLARGAALLGSGGGGDPYIGALLLRAGLDVGSEARLLTLDQLADDSLVIPVAMMGAPTVMVEKFPNGAEAERVLGKLEEILGRRAEAVIAAEIGGGNALLPLTLGAQLDLPVVDGDGMGRAFPELDMVSWNVGGVSVSPLAMSDEHGNVVTIDGCSGAHAENLARHVVMAMGGMCVIALYPMTGRQVKESTVRGTISIALEIGRTIGEARDRGDDPFAALARTIDEAPHYGRLYDLTEGKIADIERTTQGGFATGRLRIDASGQEPLYIDFQNENLIAWRGAEPCAMVPDLICVLESDTAEPLTTEALKYGQRVHVVAIGAPSMLLSEAALRVMGPGRFGYDTPYRPLSELALNSRGVP